MYGRKFRKKYGPTLPLQGMSFFALIKHWFLKKHLVKTGLKESVYLETAWKTEIPTHVPERKFNYLAIVYGEEVKEMIRVDDITAKYLLGESTLVLYDPETTLVKKEMLFVDGKFTEKPKEEETNGPS
jgi:hypothetical protein